MAGKWIIFYAKGRRINNVSRSELGTSLSQIAKLLIFTVIDPWFQPTSDFKKSSNLSIPVAHWQKPIFSSWLLSDLRKKYQTKWCTVVMSMFVSSKWQRVALPTCWRALVRALFYCYLTCDHRPNSRKGSGSRKVGAPARRERQTGLKIVSWTKHHNTDRISNSPNTSKCTVKKIWKNVCTVTE